MEYCSLVKEWELHIKGKFILCLNEIWLKPEELHVIADTIKDSPSLTDFSFNVFAKSGMQDIDPDYTGRSFGGTAIIC